MSLHGGLGAGGVGGRLSGDAAGFRGFASGLSGARFSSFFGRFSLGDARRRAPTT